MKAIQHRIELDKANGRPIPLALHRTDPKARDLEKQEPDRMLTMTVIEPTQTGWASPIVLLPKKCDTFRFCLVRRKSNSEKVYNSYLIPDMDESVDSLRDAAIF